MDYREVELSTDAVIYCDIPYRHTKGYGNRFDHEEFYEWALNQANPIYISEYLMPEDKFEVVAERTKRNTLSPTVNLKRTECIYTPRK